MKYKIILFVTIVFLSGCSFIIPKENPSPTVKEIPSSKTTPENKNITIKTQYGFNFNVPEGWKLDHTEPTFPPYKEAVIMVNISNPATDYIKITIEPLSTAPTSTEGIDQGEDIILTQKQIGEFKNDIEKNGKTIDGVKVLSSISYDVPGGGFYPYAKFFHKNNLVTIYYSISEPIENMTWGPEAREKISDTLERIRQGEMTDTAKKEKEFFEDLIFSLKFQ